MTHGIGSFVREYVLDGVTFLVRGLTVAEYMDLSSQGFLSSNRIANTLFVSIGVAGIIGWDGVVDKDSGVSVPYGEEIKEHLPEGVLSKVGEYIYTELSVLNEEEVEKFRGFVRFLFYVSDDKNKEQVKYFDCDNCIQSGVYLSRPCGRKQGEIEAIRERLGLESRVEGNDKPRKSSRYSNKKLKRKKEAKAKKAGNTYGKLVLLDYDFPECPVTWVDKDIQDWVGRLYTCANTNTLFFEGGLGSQLNKVYEMQKVISSETSSIEGELRESK